MATPGEEQTPSNIGDDAYDKKFNSQTGNLRNKEQEAVKKSEQSEDVRSQEKTAIGHWKTTTNSSEKRSQAIRSRLRGNIRNKSSFVFVLIVLLAGLWYSSVFAPNLILVNVKDLFTNDLADATTALSKYTVKMIDYKLGKADCGDPDTIKCKLTTMSRAQVLTFQKHGFKINGQKIEEDNLDDNDPSNNKPESRWKVNSIAFPDGAGSASSGEQYAKIASSNDDLRHLANSVWNPRSSFFMDVRYKQRIKTQFDLDKIASVSGSSAKEVDESFDASMQGGEEKIDRSGRGAFSLKTLASQKAQTAFSDTATDIAKQAHSYTNAQCGFYTQGKVVYNATKKAKEVTIARFAMQYLKAADQIKAGLSKEIPANVLSGKLAWSSDGGYNGANATDASMYRHIVLREPVEKSQNGMKYYADAFDAIGALAVPSLQIMLTATATKGIANNPGNLSAPPADLSSDPVAYCLNGQTGQSKSALKPGSCPALTGAAGAAPLLAPLAGALGGIASASTRICPMPPQGIWQMNPTASATSTIVMPLVANLFNSAVSSWATTVARDFTSKTKGVAASDAIFAGTGIILGDMAMSRGMQPATHSSLEEYLAQKTEDDKEYESLARYEAARAPFDIYNSYSFLGSLVRSVNPASSTTSSDALGAIANVLAVIPSSISKTTSRVGAIYNLQPAPLDTSRLQCPDAEYKSIGIEADMGCNVRYSLGKAEMDANINDVLDYMLKEHPEESRDKIQDLQQRLGKTDTAEPQDPAEVQRMLSEAQGASNKPFIDKKTGEATKNSEYEKYLTYCVNREDPWGRSALDVRREELSAEEKEKRRLDTFSNGSQVKGLGSEYELKQTASYVGVTEGAKADQDWYTGKKCLDDSKMLQNFRAYTMACSVDGSFAGSLDCTEADRAGAYTDSFYTSNDIQYLSAS
ncbi:hypothetical protein HY312_02850 [Candidatus Saccharibacteria bacterium]|nr:hypothetical protein [Candidatus Saccharibacteria bacterium]